MFSRFFEIVKRHPMWIVGGVIAVVILIWLMSRGGGSSTAVVTIGPSDAQVQASAAERIAQITTNAETVQAQLGLEKNAQDVATAIALAGIQKDMSANDNATAAGIVTSNNAAAIQINQQNVTGATTVAQSTLNTQLAMANLQYQVDMQSIAADMQVQKNADWLNAQVAAIKANAGKLTQIQNPLTGNLQVIGQGAG